MANIKLKDGDVFSFVYNNKHWDCEVVGWQVNLFYPSTIDMVTAYNVSSVERFFNDISNGWKLTTPITNKHEKENNMSTDNKLSITHDIYFDVAKHAKAWGVKHEEASEIIQKELFKNGMCWSGNSDKIQHTTYPYLCVIIFSDGPFIFFDQNAPNYKEATLQAHTIYTLDIQQPEEEVVELMGKKYSKADIEKALSLLQPKEA